MPRIQAYKKKYMVRDFAHYVKDKTKEMNMTQAEVAEVLGTTQQNLSYKINHDAFSYADFLALMEIFKPDEKEVMRLVKSW